MKYRLSIVGIVVILVIFSFKSIAQPKKISPNLFGIFFEDLSYAADGGLYAELIQNGSFEYSPTDRKGWNSFTNWNYVVDGHGYGALNVKTNNPINANNPHYLSLKIEYAGQQGIGIDNSGFDGIAIDSDKKYRFSVWLRSSSNHSLLFKVFLKDAKQQICGESSIVCNSNKWQWYETEMTARQACDSASLFLLAQDTGTVDIDMVSLFPDETFKNRSNGMRKDIAETIASLHPKFMRFPGGCLTHGDGIGNIYNWKKTIGPLKQRTQQKNIWKYHQSVGLGFFEYFQFCEDIGAKPLPVLAAGVSCQNSGGTRGTGQQAIPMDQMQQYVQDVLDLIEYANGSSNTEWGAKRAAAGHPAPFHLQYIGIGNEDKQTEAFRERFKMIYDAVKAKHPEITVIGTVGPFHSGEDYDLGWKFADTIGVPMVDEHYYEKPKWFIQNQYRYDKYNRSKSKVYLGEYASQGNTLWNALSEAAFMTSLERNGDIVAMSSYAPLLANSKHISWNPDLIYFDNRNVLKTVNYYVQQLFSNNDGSKYYPDVVKTVSGKNIQDSIVASSVVEDEVNNGLIIKIVNLKSSSENVRIALPTKFKHYKIISKTILSGNREDKNTFEHPYIVVPHTDYSVVKKINTISLLPYSFYVIRLVK